MNKNSCWLTLMALLCALPAAQSWAHGHRGFYGGPGGYGRSGFGFYFNAPLPVYPYYPQPYYYPPAVVTVPSQPPVYIQQAPAVVQQNPPGYWYYCNNPQGYYPSVRECYGSWQQVPPSPPLLR